MVLFFTDGAWAFVLAQLLGTGAIVQHNGCHWVLTVPEEKKRVIQAMGFDESLPAEIPLRNYVARLLNAAAGVG